MSTTIQIKRSSNTAIPSSLAVGEPAYSQNSDILYIGGTNGAIIPIGGKRTPGTLTANQALVANATSYMDVLKTANLYIGTVTVNVINTVANSTVLGLPSNSELTSTWAIKTYVDAKSLTPGGSNTQVQYNDSGTFGGSSALVFDKNTATMSVLGTLVNTVITSTSVAVSNATQTTTIIPGTITTGVLGGSQINTAANLNITSANVSMTSAVLSAKDIVVSGNLTINGTLTSIDATNLQVKDAMIKLADQQTTLDALSIGFYGEYGNTILTQYTGMFRDQANAAVWTLFNTSKEPTTTVDTANTTYSIGTLFAKLNSYGFVSNATNLNLTANSTLAVAIVANTLTLSTPLNTSSGGTGLSTIGTDGQLLQCNSTSLTFGMLDGGVY